MEVDNFPDYLISNEGKVWSKRRKIYLKEQTLKNGYKFIGLRKDNKQKNFLIHRLIGIHYIPNPENKPTIDHINRNRSDNRVENLRWATQKEQNENRKEYCIRSDNSSGHKNISYCKRYKRWIYVKGGKYKIIKYFKSKTDALCFKYIYLLKIKSGIIINGRNKTYC